MSVEFFPGLHHPGDARHFERACVSIRHLWRRKKPVGGSRHIVDSGAFRELELHGEYQVSVDEYAGELHRLHSCGAVDIAVAVAQDFMCEPSMLEKTKATGASDGTVADHQRLTIERYDALRLALAAKFGGEPPFPLMPVLQGYRPAEYEQHAIAYGDRLKPGMWVGIGSVCKRQGDPRLVADVARPLQRFGFRLHGFGVKLTALLDPEVRDLLATADSMAWSYAARRQGRDANDWREAMAFAKRVDAVLSLPRAPYQLQLFEAA